MKLVIISVPAMVNDNEIVEAASQFAAHLDMTGLKCNILGKNEITIDNPSTTIHSLIKPIIQRCNDKNPTVIAANFWRMVSMGEIPKQTLLKLTIGANRIIAKKYLASRNADCFLTLFDTALTMM